MNAPATVDHLAEPTLELLPIAAIAVSETHIQQRRRRRFNPDALAELAESIREIGLQQPIVVRPLEAMRGLAKYELVAGERRWLACDRAGLAHVPARVSVLSDAQVLKIQLVENLQREDLGAMEEAEGYRELMALEHLTSDQVAKLIGKSRSYVYTRTKLLDLVPEAAQAVEDGQLDASKALLLASIRAPKLQRQALKLLRDEGDYYSHRRLAEKLRDKFMVDLDTARFDRADASLFRFVPVPGRRGQEDCVPLPACGACPANSDNDASLRLEIRRRWNGEDAGAHVCTDRDCFDAKVACHFDRRRKAAQDAGRPVIDGDEAKRILPNRWSDPRGYIDLDAECEEDECPEPKPRPTGDPAADDAARDAWDDRCSAYQPRTYRQILGDQVPATTLIADPHQKGALRELLPAAEARKALKPFGIKLRLVQAAGNPEDDADESTPAERAAERAKQAAREAAETEFRRRVLRECYAKWKGPLKREDWLAIAEAVTDQSYSGFEIVTEAVLDGKTPDLRKLTDADLVRLVMITLVADATENRRSSKPLMDLAQRLKVNPQAIKQKLKAETAAKAKGEESAPTKAKSPSKPKPKSKEKK